jgi:pimeloyl-ACP methyl ester carboxylesterase
MRGTLFLFVFLAHTLITGAQHIMPYPGQPASGPGGAEYAHHSVFFYDFAERADGYWLFVPADPAPDSADVVVFLHGYGAYNPFTYGKWIKHLVAKGNIVIYPRYQRNLMAPRPDQFPANAAKGIRDALAELQKSGKVYPRTEKIAYIGHSYGGVIAANLAVHRQQYDIPPPAAMMLCEPGSGPFKGALLQDYSGLPPDMNLQVIVGEDDYVVGDTFGRLVFNTATRTSNRNLIIQRSDTSKRRWILATHSEPYSFDMDFDNGVRNYTAIRVLQSSRLNEVDFNCYWKLADALLAFTREGRLGDVAFGNTDSQRFMGLWADGTPIRPLEVVLPPVDEGITAQKPSSGAESRMK